MSNQEQFDKLNPIDQYILQCYSIYYEECNVTEFSALLAKLKIKDESGKAFNSTTGSLKLNQFVRNKLLVQHLAPSKIVFVSVDFKEFLIFKAAQTNKYSEVCGTIKANYSPTEHSWYHDKKIIRINRDYRMAVYGNDRSFLELRLDESKEPYAEYQNKIILDAFTHCLTSQHLKGYSDGFQARALRILLTAQVHTGQNIQPYLTHWKSLGLPNDNYITYFECSTLILAGQFKEVRKIIDAQTELIPNVMSLLGLIEVMEGNYETAIKTYEEAIKVWKKITGKKKGYLMEWSFIGYGLALYKTKEPAFFTFYKDFEAYGQKNFQTMNYVNVLGGVYHFFTNNTYKSLQYLKGFDWTKIFESFWYTVMASNIPKAPFESNIVNVLGKAEINDQKLVEREALYYISTKSPSLWNDNRQARLEHLNKTIGTEPLGSIIPVVEDWARSLNVLLALGSNLEGKKGTDVAEEAGFRMAWQIDFSYKRIQPIEQKRGKTGWSVGRNVALKRLANSELDYLSPQDLKAVKEGLGQETTTNGWGYYGAVEYGFDWDKTVLALVEHPLLFLSSNTSLQVNLVKSEVALQIKQSKNQLKVNFDIDFDETGIKVVKETATRYKVYHITPLHLKVIQSFEGKSLSIPASGKESLLKALGPLSKQLNIQSDLDEQLENLPSIEADHRIYALLNPINDGFHLEFFVKPFGSVAPYIKPGKGSENLVATVDNVRTQTKRNLKKERNLLADVEEMCPTLAATESDNYEWMFETPEDCLQALLEIEKPKQEDKLVIEWPKGQKLKLMGNISFDNLKMNVASKNNWFEVSGEVKVIMIW